MSGIWLHYCICGNRIAMNYKLCARCLAEKKESEKLVAVENKTFTGHGKSHWQERKEE